MDGDRPDYASGVRQVAGAWIFCAVLAVLAFGLTSHADGVIPAAAETAGLSPCASASGSRCRPSADADLPAAFTTAGLHLLSTPPQARSAQHRPG